MVASVRDWFRVVLQDARSRAVPTVFIRYEDLVMTPEREYGVIMRLLTGLNA